MKKGCYGVTAYSSCFAMKTRACCVVTCCDFIKTRWLLWSYSLLKPFCNENKSAVMVIQPNQAVL